MTNYASYPTTVKKKQKKKKTFEQLLISGYDNRPVIVKMACQ